VHLAGSYCDVPLVAYLVFPLDKVELACLSKAFQVQKTFAEQSKVSVSVPPLTVQLLPLPDWSVTEALSFKIKKPFHKLHLEKY